MSITQKENIKVLVRVRPLSLKEKQENSKCCITITPENKQ